MGVASHKSSHFGWINIAFRLLLWGVASCGWVLTCPCGVVLSRRVATPSQLGVNLSKGERSEFLWVKIFPFLPRIALHFYLKNKKVLGRRGSTFCPRKSKNLGSHFFFLPFQVKKSVCTQRGSLYQSAVQSTSTPSNVRPVPSPPALCPRRRQVLPLDSDRRNASN